jgi:hypothetical protein
MSRQRKHIDAPCDNCGQLVDEEFVRLADTLIGKSATTQAGNGACRAETGTCSSGVASSASSSVGSSIRDPEFPA